VRPSFVSPCTAHVPQLCITLDALREIVSRSQRGGESTSDAGSADGVSCVMRGAFDPRVTSDGMFCGAGAILLLCHICL
jgi:hypothetical protein